MRHEKHHLIRWLSVISAAGFALVFCAGAIGAQNAPTIGSGNVAVADPAIPRPNTKPCVVDLFPKQNFASTGDNKRMDAEPRPFQYSPPANCKGPWAKIVLEADFSVDPGYQYDRTVSIWLKGVNLYFGTTQEPSPDVGPSWQVQRDLTDYSELLGTPGEGMAWINNWLDSVRSSVIHAGAKLLFYPADSGSPAPAVPDVIYALNGKGTTPGNVKSASEQLSRSIAFPRNTTRVYLDVFAQPQFHDEFYYRCLEERFVEQTSAFALKRGYKGAPKKPRACGGGNFREVAVSIDGQAAGLAPISPWVFTGGMDPFLWRPTPGVETLNFMPYRVDLTPFAGRLSDGNQHTVAVKVLDANNFFSLAGALLVYRDMQIAHTGGDVTSNTLQGASLEPTVTSTLGNISAPGVNGDVTTQASKDYVIEGYVNTSKGKVSTRVENGIRFGNVQQFDSSDQGHRDIVRLTAHAQSKSSSSGEGSQGRHLQQTVDYTLYVDTLSGSDKTERRDRTVTLQQDFERHILQGQDGMPLYQASIRNSNVSSDHVNFDPKDRKSYSDRGQNSTQTYSFRNSLGDCYQSEVQARDGKVSGFAEGQGCPNAKSALHWFVHPDGSPDSYGWRLAGQH
jgi:hypothetical protein